MIKHNNISDPVDKAIWKYKFHPSILLIKSELENQKLFLFQTISKSCMEEKIQSIVLKRATTKNTILTIPSKTLKVNCKNSPETLQDRFNECLITDNFPDNLKLADITTVFKKKDPLNKKNYRPVSVLSGIFKIFENHIQKQINGYLNNFLSLYFCDLNGKKVVDKKGIEGALLMDLFKVFDTIIHDPLISKLHAYGFDKKVVFDKNLFSVF